ELRLELCLGLVLALVGLVLRPVIGLVIKLVFELRLRLCLEFRLYTRPQIARGTCRYIATQMPRQRIGERGSAFRRWSAAESGLKLLRHLCEIVIGLGRRVLRHGRWRARRRFGARRRSMLGRVQPRRQLGGESGKAVSRTCTSARLRR